MNNKEYVGYDDNYRIKYSGVYIGTGRSEYSEYIPNIIVKWGPSAHPDHDFYFQGTAYRPITSDIIHHEDWTEIITAERITNYREAGTFTSYTGPDEQFHMPNDAKAILGDWHYSSYIEPDYGRRHMDSLPTIGKDGVYQYVTYPHLSSQSNNIFQADLTTWGSGGAEIVRFYQPNLVKLDLMFNNSMYTALRNFYIPNATSARSSFGNIGGTGNPYVSATILELENFYAPQCHVYNPYAFDNVSSIKNANMLLFKSITYKGSAFASGNYGSALEVEDLTANKNDYWDICPAIGVNKTCNENGIRCKVDGDIWLQTSSLDEWTGVLARKFVNCDIGTKKATNIYIGGTNNKPTTRHNELSADDQYFYQCTFGPYPVNIYE